MYLFQYAFIFMKIIELATTYQKDKKSNRSLQ